MIVSIATILTSIVITLESNEHETDIIISYLNVSGPKEEKVLELCEKLEEKGFRILELFNLLQEKGLSHSMKSIVPKELYDKAISHMPAELNVDELKIPNIPFEDLKACCNG